MYTPKHRSQTREAFFIAFGRYMAPVPSASSEKVNWINYHTGVKHLYFRLKVEDDRASVRIEIEHPDTATRQLYFDQLLQMRDLLEKGPGSRWTYTDNHANQAGKVISTVSADLDGVNVLRQEDWPAIISFFKANMIALDAFWLVAKDVIAE